MKRDAVEGEAGGLGDNLIAEFKTHLRGDPKSSHLDAGKEGCVDENRRKQVSLRDPNTDHRAGEQRWGVRGIKKPSGEGDMPAREKARCLKSFPFVIFSNSALDPA